MDDAVRDNKKLTFPYRPDKILQETEQPSIEWLYLKEKYGYNSFYKEGNEWILKKEN